MREIKWGGTQLSSGPRLRWTGRPPRLASQLPSRRGDVDEPGLRPSPRKKTKTKPSCLTRRPGQVRTMVAKRRRCRRLSRSKVQGLHSHTLPGESQV